VFFNELELYLSLKMYIIVSLSKTCSVRWATVLKTDWVVNCLRVGTFILRASWLCFKVHGKFSENFALYVINNDSHWVLVELMINFTCIFKVFTNCPQWKLWKYAWKFILKEARNSFFGLGVHLLKSKFRIEGKLRFPCYYPTFSTYDQSLFSHWFPSNSCHHSNGSGQPLILNNVKYLEN